MGAVLAMRPLMRSALFGLAALALAGCSSDQHTTSLFTEAGLAAKAAFKSRGAPRAAVAPGGVPQGLTRAAIAGRTEPMILTNVDKLGSAGTLVKTGENQGFVTWVSQDRLTLTTKGGVLAASRGLIHDLLSADAAPTLAALRAGGAPAYSKQLRHIGPDRQVLVSNWTCQMAPAGAETIVILERSHAVRRFAETCNAAAGESLRNDYWLGGDGFIWRSRQFLHPETGYVEIRHLIR